MTNFTYILAGVAVAALCTTRTGTSQGIEIDWHTVSNGGGLAQGGSLELEGTIGQAAAGPIGGGSYSLESGYWAIGDTGTVISAIADLRAIPGPDRVRLEWLSVNANVDSFVVSRATSPGGSFSQLGIVPSAAIGERAYVDASAMGGTVYTYQLSERYVPGPTIPRDQIQAKPYGSALPGNMARAGSGAGSFPTISAAIASAPPGTVNWVVTVESGVYPHFNVTATAPDNLRVIADGTGDVVIDTSVRQVTIHDRTANQTLELHGLIIGSTSTTENGLVVSRCAGPVILDELKISSGPSNNAVQLRSSPSGC